MQQAFGLQLISWYFLLFPGKLHKKTKTYKNLTSISNLQHATYSLVVSGLDLFRVWYGPLPPEFCQLCLLLKGTLTYTMPFIMAGIVILKLLYICVWRGFRQMDDDLVVSFARNFGCDILSDFQTLCSP